MILGPKHFKQKLRSALTDLACLGFHLRSRPLELGANPKVLIVSPHPDDETLGCGGLIHQLSTKGAPPDVLLMTRGEASHPGHPLYLPEQIAERRLAEFRAATGSLGLSEQKLHLLGAPDGRLARLNPREQDQLREQLQALLLRLAPTHLFLAHPHDGSSEHEAAARLLLPLPKGLQGCPCLGYLVWALWSPRRSLGLALRSREALYRLDCRKGLTEKRRALAAYASQAEALAPWDEPVVPTGFMSHFLRPFEYFFSI